MLTSEGAGRIRRAPRVLVAGHFNMDETFVGSVGRRRALAAGGAAAYAAVGAWLAGGHVTVVTRVGRDHPPAIIERMEDAGIEVRVGRHDVPTMASATIYDRLGRRRFLMRNPRADLDLLTPTAQEILAVPADAVHLGPLPAMTVLAVAQAGPRPLGIDAHPTSIRPDRAGFSAAFAAADVALLAEGEWRAWLGPATFDDWLRRAPLGPSIVGVRRGASGALVHDTTRGSSWRVPALRVTVVDPTGAGDAFCGAFLARWVCGDGMARSLSVATAAASIVIEGFGCLAALDRRDEMEGRASAAIPDPPTITTDTHREESDDG